MRSIHEVLREREMQAEKLKDEIEKLRAVVRILEGTDAKPAAPVAVAPVAVAPVTVAPVTVAPTSPASRWP